MALCDATKASSVHVTFAREAEAKFLASTASCSGPTSSFTGTMTATRRFDDFLATLNSRHRKAIKRERREALAAGITIHRLTGSDITEDAWDAFFAFYMETGSRKWGRPYLTRTFFSLIGESMAKDVLLVMAKRNGRWIAGAINFIGSDTLFGRNWGAIEHHPFLHFEVCYYQAIDFAIQRGLKIGRGRRAGRAQARARLPAADHLFRALHRRPRSAPRDRRLSEARARLCRRGRARTDRGRTVPQGRRRGLTLLTAPTKLTT